VRVAMKHILTVLEYGGAAGQDIVRGSIFKPYFSEANIVADYAGRHPSGMRRLRSSSSALVQQFSRSFGYKIAMTLYERTGMFINDQNILNRAKEYDVIHLIKVSSLEFISKLRSSTSARLVYDLGDALWLPFYQNQYPNISSILSLVDAVTGDNLYALDYAKKFNQDVYLWPTIAQVEKFDLARGRPKPSLRSGIITIGWIGAQDTVYNLYKIWEALEKVFLKYDHIHLRLLGPGRDYFVLPQFENVRFSVLPGYTSDVMITEILGMDIGIFPMFDTINSAARGILKALVYMSGEAVVIGSPRGDMLQLIQDGENGCLAETDQEWIQKLEMLIENIELRNKLAQAGLETVRSNYTIRQSFDCLLKALKI
jgi:glycosyltransferase involved in cell wall biosynthesis